MNGIKSHTKQSVRDYWETPQWLVDQVAELLKVFMALDPCSNFKNKKGVEFITEEDNGLMVNWYDFMFHSNGNNNAVWVNPPFSELDKWIDKVIHESQQGLTVCLLHPDTPDTAWYQKIEEHCFLQLVPTSRINFIDPETGQEKTGVNFPSCISVFNAFPRTNVQRVRFELNKPKKARAA